MSFPFRPAKEIISSSAEEGEISWEEGEERPDTTVRQDKRDPGRMRAEEQEEGSINSSPSDSEDELIEQQRELLRELEEKKRRRDLSKARKTMDFGAAESVKKTPSSAIKRGKSASNIKWSGAGASAKRSRSRKAVVETSLESEDSAEDIAGDDRGRSASRGPLAGSSRRTPSPPTSGSTSSSDSSLRQKP